MSKREIKYTDEPIGEIKFVADFLPPPDQLHLTAGDRDVFILALLKIHLRHQIIC